MLNLAKLRRFYKYNLDFIMRFNLAILTAIDRVLFPTISVLFPIPFKEL